MSEQKKYKYEKLDPSVLTTNTQLNDAELIVENEHENENEKRKRKRH